MIPQRGAYAIYGYLDNRRTRLLALVGYDLSVPESYLLRLTDTPLGGAETFCNEVLSGDGPLVPGRETIASGTLWEAYGLQDGNLERVVYHLFEQLTEPAILVTEDNTRSDDVQEEIFEANDPILEYSDADLDANLEQVNEDNKLTQEQEAELKLKKSKLREHFLPLYEKSGRQLVRFEKRFLAAAENKLGGESEAEALRDLYYAQEVWLFYRSRISNVSYAYDQDDLGWNDYGHTYSED